MRNPFRVLTKALFDLRHPRSAKWPKVRKDWLRDNPACAACGSVKDLQVHHKRPFHLFPAEELVRSNLITLCETMGVEHHFRIGHTVSGKSSWLLYNPNVVRDAAAMLRESPIKTIGL
jgi:5-methylcytosine-specific restriction protein A